jgi:hypothetical protein
MISCPRVHLFTCRIYICVFLLCYFLLSLFAGLRAIVQIVSRVLRDPPISRITCARTRANDRTLKMVQKFRKRFAQLNCALFFDSCLLAHPQYPTVFLWNICVHILLEARVFLITSGLRASIRCAASDSQVRFHFSSDSVRTIHYRHFRNVSSETCFSGHSSFTHHLFYSLL